MADTRSRDPLLTSDWSPASSTSPPSRGRSASSLCRARRCRWRSWGRRRSGPTPASSSRPSPRCAVGGTTRRALRRNLQYANKHLSNSKHPNVPVCVQYFWSSDGPVGDLSQKSHKKLQLERGILRGGRTYNFSVVVLSSQVEHCLQKIRANYWQISFQANLTGTGWTLVTVESLGPQAVLSANKVSIVFDRELVFYIYLK